MKRRIAFDGRAFYAALDAVRGQRGVLWKQVASDTGVTASTLTRLGQGRRPDIDGFAALVDWAELSADDYVIRRHRPGPTGALVAIAVALRADPRLDDRAVTAIETTVTALYQALATP